jgi:tetratricopeptide (TPR) repeat protein
VVLIRRALAALLVVAGLFACISTAVAANGPVDPPTNGLLAFSDSRSVLPASFLQQQLVAKRSTLCEAYGGRAATVSFSAALRHWQQFVLQAGHRGVSQLARNPVGRSEASAIAAAAALVMDNHRAAALAALARAHTLKPGDPRPLVDAAPLLTDAGHAADALALLNRAAGMHADHAAPFGVDLKAAAQANKGYALLALGRAQQALAPLSSALSRAPLLREARVDLAAAETCTSNPSKAAVFLAAGGRRQAFRGDLVGGSSGTPSEPPVEDIFDLSKGQVLTLPAVAYPTSIGQAAAMRDTLNETTQQEQVQTGTALSNRASQLETQLDGTYPKMNRMTFRRTADIITAVHSATLDPRISAWTNQIAALETDRSAAQQSGVDDVGYPVCSQVNGAYARMYKDTLAIDGLERQIAVLEYRIRTGLAGNLANPLAHETALAIARSLAHGSLVFTLGSDQILTNAGFQFANACHTTEVAPDPIEKGTTDTPSSSPCPQGSGLNIKVFSAPLFGVSLNFDCESFGISADAGEGWIKAFGSVKYNIAKGEMTVFAGPSATVPINHIGKLTVRDGLYLTVGSDGVRDAGARVESKATIGSGDVTLSQTASKMDFTVVGIHPVDDLVDLVTPSHH